MNASLQQKLKDLPRSPGVYFHKTQNGEIIYVGKAAVLRNRVRQYFQSGKDFDIKTRALVAEIHDTDWLETESEIDALFLESEMVKRYMPRYNILLRDDKSQLFVRITMRDEWPIVGCTRNPSDDGATYIGPFYNGYAVKKALRYLRRVFPYYVHPPGPQRSTLDAHLGLSPSAGMTSKEYKSSLKKLIAYVEGGRVAITREIERDMKRAAREHQFEVAAELRNKLQALTELQHRIMFGDREFLDISKDRALMQISELLGLRSSPARIEGYDISHMSGTNVVASMVVFTNGVSDRSNYRKFKLSVQQNDDYASMHETLLRRCSQKNIAAWGKPDLIIIDGGKGQLAAAQAALEERGVSVPLLSIAKREEEMIVPSSHPQMDNTTLTRLITHPQPGVYVYHQGEVFVVNLHAGVRNASPHSRNLRGGDHVGSYDDVIKLFQRIRDESHRFAVSYHTTLKRRSATKSILDDIPGVGPITRKKLMKAFGGGRGAGQASEDKLATVVGQKLARVIWQHFHPSKD